MAEKTQKKEAAPGFDAAMGRLEKIVGEMESGTLSLEKMIERFEEGQKLIKTCSKTLNEVERKIEVLVRKGDDVVAEPFEPDADAKPADDQLF